MNKNVVGVILIVAAGALFFLYGWPKIKPYLASDAPPAASPGTVDGITTMPM
jgi:hypothetical protein